MTTIEEQIAQALSAANERLAQAEIALTEAMAAAAVAREDARKLKAAYDALTGQEVQEVVAGKPAAKSETVPRQRPPNPDPYASIECSACSSKGKLRQSIKMINGSPVRMLICGACSNQSIS